MTENLKYVGYWYICLVWPNIIFIQYQIYLSFTYWQSSFESKARLWYPNNNSFSSATLNKNISNQFSIETYSSETMINKNSYCKLNEYWTLKITYSLREISTLERCLWLHFNRFCIFNSFATCYDWFCHSLVCPQARMAC